MRSADLSRASYRYQGGWSAGTRMTVLDTKAGTTGGVGKGRYSIKAATSAEKERAISQIQGSNKHK
jgi:hypothetical protein